VVENNSEDNSTFLAYEQMKKQYANLKIVVWDGPFNFSAINNLGAASANGDYYLLLNNDTELMEPDSIADMLGICMRSDVGCVGAKLFFADDTIQHAGVVLGFGGFAGHVFSLLRDSDYGYMMRPRINCNYSAVTGACLMVKKSVFDEVGGLREEFAVGLNDVDFCLKVRDKGYMIVYDAFAKWHHYESKSRGYDEDSPEKKERLNREVLLFRSYWGDVLDAGDPFYNKNFPVTIAPFTLGD
jgi:GT2 family glycosyltransferase